MMMRKAYPLRTAESQTRPSSSAFDYCAVWPRVVVVVRGKSRAKTTLQAQVCKLRAQLRVPFLTMSGALPNVIFSRTTVAARRRRRYDEFAVSDRSTDSDVRCRPAARCRGSIWAHTKATQNKDQTPEWTTQISRRGPLYPRIGGLPQRPSSPSIVAWALAREFKQTVPEVRKSCRLRVSPHEPLPAGPTLPSVDLPRQGHTA